jgi:hypothetical protein
MALNSVLKRKDGYIEVRFDFDRKMIDAVKKIPGRSWINDRRVWEFPGDSDTLSALKCIFGKRLETMLENRFKAS